MKNKKYLILLTYLMIFRGIFAINLYEEYQNARKFYFEKDYTKAAFSLEKVINEVPDYEGAKLLYFKVKYETGERFKIKVKDSFDFEYKKIEGTTIDAAKLFYELIKTNDDTRKDLFNYLMLHDELELLEAVYDSLDNKESVKNIFLEFLYLNKQYDKISEKYPDESYMSRIESDKAKADEYYFNALKMLKENKATEALTTILKVVKMYPENYVYYFKIGQVYADNKNFDLAEYNFKKALMYKDVNEIKINLFNLYYTQEKFDDAYEISRDINHLPEIREKLRNIYYKQEDKNVYVKVITRVEDKITMDKRVITKERNLEIGDTFTISSGTPGVYDSKTGEKLATRATPVARIRVSNIEEKLVTFEIVEEYVVVLVNREYIIGKKEEL